MEALVNPAAGTRRDDEHLAQLAADGSEKAFVALYERYHDQLCRYCCSIVHNDADAQDAAQSALIGAFAALRHGKRDAPLRPWLFRIAHNESVSVLRRRRPEEQLSELLPDRSTSTEERVEQRERLALLMADLYALPERQRGALVMRELNDLSYEEIAIALRTSVGAAKQTIFEARRALLEFAEGRTMACEEIQRTISDADGRALRRRRVRAHLHDCPACAAFAAAIPARRATLQAVAAPLPAIGASGLLAGVLVGINEAAPGAGGVLTSAAGKTAGAMLASKALAGVVIVAGVTVGTTAAVPRFAHPSVRTAPGTTIRATGGAPFTSRAFTAPRVQDVSGCAGGPQAGCAAASPHVGSAGRGSPTRNSVTGGAGAAPTVHGATGPTAGIGPAAQRPPHPGRSSTAPGRGASPGSGRAAAPGRGMSHGGGDAPGRAVSHGGGRPAAPGRGMSHGGGDVPGRAVSHGGGRPAAPGKAVWQGAPQPFGPPATSGGATTPSPARPAPPGHAASQGPVKSPGPPADPGGAASPKPKPKPKPDHGASHGGEQPATPPAAPAKPPGAPV